jgi:CRP/FNR family cyclic AMP-dependent transcriptional regulator
MPVPVAALAELELFDGLEPHALVRVAARCSARAYARGERIGDPGVSGCSHVLSSGAARLVRPAPAGRVLVVGLVEPGALFGRLPFADERPADHGEALGECCSLSIAAADLETLARVHPPLGEHLLRELAARVRAADDRLAALATQSVAARLAGALLELGERYGRVTPTGVRVDLRLTHTQLAELVVTTRETLTKVAGWLRSEQLVRLERRELWILDGQGLERVARGAREMPRRSTRSLNAA